MPDLAIIGKAGAGKSTAAGFLEEIAGYERFSFATKLKDIAVQLWGTEARSDRAKLQGLGVAVRRIDPDTWVNLLMDQLPMIDCPVVVDDCRFPNEYWALAAAGFSFIRVTAAPELRLDRLHVMGKETTPEQLEHESETSLDSYPADWNVQNEGNKDTYLEAVAQTLQRVIR